MWLYSTVCVGPGRKPRRPVYSQRGSYHTIRAVNNKPPCSDRTERQTDLHFCFLHIHVALDILFHSTSSKFSFSDGKVNAVTFATGTGGTLAGILYISKHWTTIKLFLMSSVSVCLSACMSFNLTE